MTDRIMSRAEIAEQAGRDAEGFLMALQVDPSTPKPSNPWDEWAASFERHLAAHEHGESSA